MVYVVVGKSGEWIDTVSWVARVFTNKEDANRFVDIVMKEWSKWSWNQKENYEEGEFPLDPNCIVGTFNANVSYSVEEIPLNDELYVKT